MYINKKKLAALVLAGLMVVQFSAVVSAKTPKPAAADAAVATAAVKVPKLCIKLDRPDKDQIPRNFRTMQSPLKGLTADGLMPSKEGMDTDRASASSIFSEKEFLKVLQAVPAAPDQFYDIDLRGESHGYIDGNAISWFATKNWGNEGREQYIIENIELNQLRKLKKAGTANVYRFDDKTNAVLGAVDMSAKKVMTEKQMVESHGAHYFRIAIPDHFRPNDQEVDKFIAFYKTLPKDAWLHYHCFAGMGRTTIFMVMDDILHNATKVSFDDIIKRQAMIGIVDLKSMGTKQNWEKVFYEDRYYFTRNFYEYVKQHPDLDMKWSDWTKKHYCDTWVPDYSGKIWRVDVEKADSVLPRNFRTGNSPFHPVEKKLAGQIDPNYNVSREGFANLNISGAAQANADQFKAMVKEIRSLHNGPIYDIDLRQESHGFLNGIAVSWFGERDWSNIDKTQEQIIKDEHKRLNATMNKNTLISVLNKAKLAEAPHYIKVTDVKTEEDLAKANGINYVRITATDHVWPTADKVDMFINLYKTLPANAWLHFHCEAGVGRTSTYMAMYDMMRNPQVPLKDILYRHYLIGGNYVAYTIKKPKKTDWKADYYANKADMIKLFYKYVQANVGNNFSTSWSDYFAKHQKV